MSDMSTILLILLAAGVVAGIVLRKQQNPAGAPVLTACCVVGIAIAGMRILGGGVGASTSLSSETERIRHAAAYQLGRHLAETSAGTQALCILSSVDAGNEALQQGLEEGLDGRIPVEFSLLDEDAVIGPDAMGLSYIVVTNLLTQYPNADLFITGGELPHPAPKVAGTLRNRKMRFAAARALDPGDFIPYQRAGVFAGAVIYRPDAEEIADPTSATPEEVFAANFRLLPAGKP
jgi:hypothetical protein